jgi:glutamyl-tRNA reductase
MMIDSNRIFCLGLNHQTAPLTVRECISFSPEEVGAALHAVKEDEELHIAGVSEVILLSTCNRIELYAAVTNPRISDDLIFAALARFLAHRRGLASASFAAHTFRLTGLEAARHLCRVAAGLDSLVLGEPQIQGQVSTALNVAQEAGAAGPVLSALFSSAIRAGKRARTETEISRNASSVSAVAAQVAESVIGNLTGARVLVIGAGMMGRKAIRAFQKRGVTKLDIVNRTFERAAVLADEFGGRAHRWTALGTALSTADVVLSSTGAPNFVLEPGLVEAVLHERQTPLVLLDIAVPRDVHPEVGTLPGIHLLDIEGLETQAMAARRERMSQIPDVETIVDEEVENFAERLDELQVRSVIIDLRRKVEQIRRAELARAQRFMPDMEPDAWAQVERFSQSLVNKLLHTPTVSLRDAARSAQTADYVATVQRLFELEETGEST